MGTASCPAEAGSADDAAVDLARECVYGLLAGVLAGPRGPGGAALAGAGLDLARDAAALLREEQGRGEGGGAPLGFAELPAADLDASPLAEELRAAGDALPAEFVRVFGLVPAPECPPYETEFHPTAEPFFRAQQMADVAGFYRAFGLAPSRAVPERPDHLALELEFMAHLLRLKRLAREAGGPDAAERVEVCARAEADFFRDHLVWWAASYAAGLRHRAGHGPYAAAARLLAAFLPAERARLGAPPPAAPRLALATLGRRTDESPDEASGCAGCTAS